LGGRGVSRGKSRKNGKKRKGREKVSRPGLLSWCASVEFGRVGFAGAPGGVAVEAVESFGAVASEVGLAPVRLLGVALEVLLELTPAALVAGLLDLPLQ